MTTNPPATAATARPEFFNLPGRGPDPVCSMSRSWWLQQERAGKIQLLRLRKRGQLRASRVLVPSDKAVELIRSLTSATPEPPYLARGETTR
jgi:hypothetical protein